jgi:hypothetical protein
MPPKNPHVKVYLPQAQVDQLTQEAAKRGVSLSEMLRQALTEAKLITAPDIKWGGDRHEK